MRYQRTTTCSFCFKPGHNKRSCSTRREWLSSKLENGNVEEQSWAKRELEGLQTRKCSFCRDPDHIKPECQERDRQIRSSALDCLSIRRKILSNMYEHGLGIGSLIRFGIERFDNIRSRWIRDSHIGLVTSVLWDEISQLIILGGKMEKKEIISVEFVDEEGHKRSVFCRLPERVVNTNSIFLKGGKCEIIILSSVSEIDYPKEFLSFESCFKQVSKWYK